MSVLTEIEELRTHKLIPSGWELSTLSECCDVILGQSPPGDTYNDKGIGLPFFQGKAEFGSLFPTPVKWCSAPTKIAEKDDVLISVRAPVGPTNLSPSTCCIGRGLAAIRPLGGIEERFVLYWLRVSVDSLASKATGSTFAAISGETLRTHPIPIAPLPEQRRIVVEIETQFTRLDAAVAALERARANLKRYRAAVLAAAATGTLLPGHRSDSTASSVDAPWNVPPDWQWSTVGRVAGTEKGSITDGPFGSNLKTEHYTTSGPRVIRLQNIGDGVFIDAHAHISESHYGKLRKHEVRPDDLVIAALGQSPPRACVIPPSVGPAIVKADCIRVRPNLAVSSARFLNIVLNAEPTRRVVSSLIHGVGRPRLNLSEIRAIPVPLPPLHLQIELIEEVERRMSVVAANEIAITANLTRAERLRQAILCKAFAGQLVPQDPNDEPADVLLERIRQEHSNKTSFRGTSRKKLRTAQPLLL